MIVRNFDRIRRNKQPVVNGDGNQSLDYVYVDDCVDGLLALAGAEHGVTVNLASGRAVSVNDLTAAMLRAADRHSCRRPARLTGPTARAAGVRLPLSPHGSAGQRQRRSKSVCDMSGRLWDEPRRAFRHRAVPQRRGEPEALCERLFAAVDAAGIDTELILVDDGSTDGTGTPSRHLPRRRRERSAASA